MRLASALLPKGFAILVGTLHAQVSTLSLSSQNQFQFSPTLQVGSAFGTGTLPFQVSQVTAKLINSSASASSGVSGSIDVADANNLPVGSPVGTLSISAPVPASGSVDAVFTPDSPLILGANQSYLFVLSSVFGNWNWWETSSSNGFSTSGSDSWTMPSGISMGSGVVPSWSRADETTVPVYAYRNQLSIQGAAVPEPKTTAVAIGSVLVAWAAWRRCR